MVALHELSARMACLCRNMNRDRDTGILENEKDGNNDEEGEQPNGGLA